MKISSIQKAMSDSDDDWFEKDIDEFVVQTQEPNNIEHITSPNAPDAGNSEIANAIFADSGKFI